ncbi:MAG: RNA polymerase sigma factor FliA [SAR86 cluster bacterium]|uniref:RNA polymerase sigma factor FliA n=1 Tax=SAR86 cluster bacterium TaxID=2030880 RepID=A0A2A4XGE0_9GAMM|nr:MAG: RNA polymerase sigma factor FliA [SAR86 cluster bacterium]
MNTMAKHYKTLDAASRDALFENHLPLVKIIAHHVSLRLPPGKSVDDLIQVGMIGLLEASRVYEGNQGAEFKSYASIRIRGAILDELRRDSWMPRSVQQKSRQLSQAIKTVENRTGETATDREIAMELGVSITEYAEMLETVAGCTVFSLEDQTEILDPGQDVDLPLTMVEDDSTRKALAAVIENLPKQEQMVVVLYYNKGLNLREISEVLNVSESRVCQVHSQAVGRIRTRMRSKYDEEDL